MAGAHAMPKMWLFNEHPATAGTKIRSQAFTIVKKRRYREFTIANSPKFTSESRSSRVSSLVESLVKNMHENGGFH